MRTILFVCTGNTCRSPMAEAIARDLIASGALGDAAGLFAASAGIGASPGSPTTEETLIALERLSVEFSGRSKPLTREMIEHAHLVLCMTESHVQSAQRLVNDDPDQVAKIVLLDPQGDVTDPIGLGQEVYDELARRFRDLIPTRLEELLANEDRPRK